jgi:hypothetical protein
MKTLRSTSVSLNDVPGVLAVLEGNCVVSSGKEGVDGNRRVFEDRKIRVAAGHRPHVGWTIIQNPFPFGQEAFIVQPNL